MNLSLILALSKKQCQMQLLLPTPPKRLPIGSSGVPSVLITTSIPTSKISQIPSPTCKSLRPDTETVEFFQVADLSGLKRFLTPSFPLHRNSHGWGPKIPGKWRTVRLIVEFNHSYGCLKRTTRRPSVSSLFPSHSSSALSFLPTKQIQCWNTKW